MNKDTSRKIMWVGVQFDPDSPGRHDILDHTTITRFISHLENCDTHQRLNGTDSSSVHYINDGGCELVEIFRAPDSCRIAFGRMVDTVQEGREQVVDVKRWLMGLGVTGHVVTVFSWDPQTPYQRPIAVGMEGQVPPLSLDLE